MSEMRALTISGRTPASGAAFWRAVKILHEVAFMLLGGAEREARVGKLEVSWDGGNGWTLRLPVPQGTTETETADVVRLVATRPRDDFAEARLVRLV